jgi:hypothetical protein
VVRIVFFRGVQHSKHACDGKTLPNIYVISTFALSLILTLLSLPILWRRAVTRWEQLVYVFGVRLFGIGTGVLFSIAFPVVRGAGETPLSTLALQALAYFLGALPLWLWGGYLWGRMMAASLRVARTTDERGSH